MRTWLEGGRRPSDNSWVDRMKKEIWQTHRGTFFGPTLDAAEQLLSTTLAPAEAEKINVDHAAAILTIGVPTEVNAELKSAVTDASHGDHSGVVGFLLAMEAGGPVAGITRANFGDEGSEPHPASWHAKVGGKLLNREWVKGQFRIANAGKGGDHEWIPSDMILEVVQSATQEEGAQAGASWVLLQHNLRSPTDAVIFKPSRNPDLEAKLHAHLGEGGSAEAFAKNNVQTETFGLQGHSGALYLILDKKKVQQTRGQGEFHDGLRAIFLAQRTNGQAAYLGALKVYVKDTCWDGKLDFLPEKLRPHAGVIANGYQGKTGGAWGKYLAEVSERVSKSYEAINQKIGKS